MTETQPGGPAPDPIMRSQEVADDLGIHITTLYRKRRAGEFPPAVRLGPRSIGWRRSVVKQWEQSQPAA